MAYTGKTPVNFVDVTQSQSMNVTDDLTVGGAFTSTGIDDNATSNAVTVDSSGNVGIGTSLPSNKLDILSSGSVVARFKRDNTGGASGGISVGNNDKLFTFYADNAGGLQIYDDATERMRIDSSGNLLVGTTSASGRFTVYGQALQNASTFRVGTNGYPAINFLNSGGSQQGYIIVNASSVSYTSVSDYRLKENVTPLTGAIERVNALNPVNFAWKADGSRVDGFLAHEAQAVVPESVVGEKDAMQDEEYEVTPAVLDEDGNVVTEAVMGTRSVPDYQGIDQSKLVPLLTAALQEAIAKIETLETKVAALENA